MQQNAIIKTPFQLEKERRDLEIYNAYNELKSQPGAMATAVDKAICEQFGLFAPSTVWAIRKRVEKRLKEQEGCHAGA